jgi:lipoyl(octanoyl) transferase
MENIRLLFDPPASGPWNMAVDDALLETAAATGQATLRFYQWQEPTLSLGYFQPAADRQQHAASRDCPLVRRASGGGAILHDRELTYSLAIAPSGHFVASELYDSVHLTLITALAQFGVAAALYRASSPCKTTAAEPSPPPFLCFQRRTCSDIIFGEAKIVGSAQRRRRGAVLQHGSILLARSASAPEVSGLLELTSQAIEPTDLARRWTSALTERLGMALVDGCLSAKETQLAKTFEQVRFAAADYTFRR